MSRSVIAMIIITLVCFAVAIACLGIANIYTEVDGLSIVSHGIHVIPKNGAALTEKMEQYLVEDYKYFVARGGTSVNLCKLEGTVITMRYDTPLTLTHITEIESMRYEEQISIDRITVTLPDYPDDSRDLHICIIPGRPGMRYDMTTLDLPPEHEAELRALAGLPQRLKE